MDIDDIRDRAQGVAVGPVTAAEVDYARAILKSGTGDIASAIYVVGHCGEVGDAGLIERYMQEPYRSVLGSLALKALVRYLGLVDNYRPLIRALIMTSGNWDDDRMEAIFLAREYLTGFRDDEFGCKLIEIFLDQNSLDRLAARDVLVDILELKDDLRDPFLMDDQDDFDANHIVRVASARFNSTRSMN